MMMTIFPPTSTASFISPACFEEDPCLLVTTNSRLLLLHTMALNAHLPDKETDASLLLSFSNAAHVSATFPFQELPTEVLTHVLGYVSFYDRMTLSTCSKTLLHNITEECTPLWSTISFHNDSKCRAQKSHITGEMVATLLNRVNPIKQTSADGQHQERAFVTRVLDIGDLLGVDTAVALEPLRHSNVLEQVRLKSLYDGGRSASSATVERTLEHLRTCIPFRLFKVDFDIPDASATTKELRDRFYRDLEAAQHTRERYRQVQEQRIPCSKCDDCVTEQGKQIVPSQYGMPSHRCFECCEYFCQKGSCPCAVQECRVCGKVACEECIDSSQWTCSECQASYCSQCKEVSECEDCKKHFCQDCRKVNSCCNCEKQLCDNCVERRGISYRQPACACDGLACSECSMVTCQGCHRVLCERCREYYLDIGGECHGCEEYFCDRCCPQPCGSCYGRCICNHKDNVRQCHVCFETLCNDCALHSCCECKKKICLKCVEEGSRCRDCSKVICSECGDYGERDICSNCDKKVPRKRRRCR